MEKQKPLLGNDYTLNRMCKSFIEEIKHWLILDMKRKEGRVED